MARCSPDTSLVTVWGLSCWRDPGCSGRGCAQPRAARGRAGAAVGAGSQGTPISCAAGAADGRLPRSGDIFLSLFPSTACHICQSNDDRLRLTPIPRLVNTLLLSGWVTDGTPAAVLLRVVLVAASHHRSVCWFPFTFTWAGQTRLSFTPAAPGLSQDGRGAP